MISLRKIILTAFFVYEDNTYSLLKNQTMLKIMKSPEHLPSRYHYSTYFYKLVQSFPYASRSVFVFIILHKTKSQYKHSFAIYWVRSQFKENANRYFLPDLGAVLVPHVGHSGEHNLISQIKILL